MADRPSASTASTSSPNPTPTTTPATTTTNPRSSTPSVSYSSKLAAALENSRNRPDTSSLTPAGAAASRQGPVQQKAWTSNRNPITGRTVPAKSSPTSALREGQKVRIVLHSGAEFEGIYSNGPDPASCRLSQVQQKKPSNSTQANGSNKTQSTMTIQRKDIADARAVAAGKNEGRSTNGNRSSFRTDSAISNSRLGTERPLKAWVPDSAYEVDGSLEKSGSTGGWDQFAENERLFGIKTDYDESIYTTTIDKNHPQYKERLAAAERKAREIERSAPVTAHVAEERIMDFAGGDDADEEDKYSGVRRQQDFPPLGSGRENKYTPPARRAPTGQATVKGAPVDPAIIASQLKMPTPAPPSKQPSPKPTTDNKSPASTEKPATPVPEKPAESKPAAGAPEKPAQEEKAAPSPAPDTKKAQEAKPAETKPTEEKPAAPKPPESKAPEAKDTATARPSAVAAPAVTPRVPAPKVKLGAIPSATPTVERELLNSFRTFASNQRLIAEKARTSRAKVDKEVKLTELKKFAENFKLSTPVPKDLISIIAKDPVKQKQIQEKALHNMEELARQREAAAKEKEAKEKEAQAAKEAQAKSSAEQSGASTPAGAADTRNTARPTAPQHSGSAMGIPGRHPNNRSTYNPQPHYPQYNRGGRPPPPPHIPPQTQPTGNLTQRLRNIEQQKMQHPHMGQHAPPDMRLPPTGPANSVGPDFGRRVGGVPPAYMGPKLNPTTHEFRPNAFAAPFNPAVPSQGSSPRSSVNNVVVEPPVIPPPVKGQLIRRKTRAVDVKKCFILSYIETLQPPQGRSWEDNSGLKPAFDTLPTWRQLQDELEAPDSTMHLTYKEYFERLPLSSAAVATPNPSHVMPQVAHQHPLPFHLQHGAQTLAPRQSPHMPPMQVHAGQHGHVPHVPFAGPDDHRMMHSNSAQSFASPRMGPVPMAPYPPAVSAPGQIPYQPVMQPYMSPAPHIGQFRSFSHQPGPFMPQQPHPMGTTMIVQPGFMGPNGMVAAGPMYSGTQPPFIPPPPPAVPGSNGFPSPGRPAAAMMVHQGSHQGTHQPQQAVYAMSPAVPYQQPAYTPPQPQGKFSGQRPQ
ncbi:hypothetical protein VTJ04DRAFT_9357 [Mycothermus thermophilus]|uniref:uncharacterized protein n=1 Tax=Humicola insolens TaxID=85995 RepID=UPI0037438B0F